MMKVKAKTDFSSNTLGNVQAESEVEVSDEMAEHLVDLGVCYETKVKKPKPVTKPKKKPPAPSVPRQPDSGGAN